MTEEKDSKAVDAREEARSVIRKAAARCRRQGKAMDQATPQLLREHLWRIVQVVPQELDLPTTKGLLLLILAARRAEVLERGAELKAGAKRVLGIDEESRAVEETFGTLPPISEEGGREDKQAA